MLVHMGATTEKCVAPHLHVASQLHSIGEHSSLTYMAIVRHMGVGQDESPCPQEGLTLRCGRSIHRGIFPDSATLPDPTFPVMDWIAHLRNPSHDSTLAQESPASN
jgi:hypothetical protein